MPTVADVLRRYGGQYLERFGATMPGEHKKVLHAITACRTGELGTVLYACQSCGEIHAIGRSCGNRHCPTCQHDKTKAWLEKQTDRLLPCPYFLATFTLPAELRTDPKPSARDLRRAVRGFQRGAARLGREPEICGHRSPRLLRRAAHVGPDTGVPPARALRRAGGGIDEAGSRWLPSRVDFLVPVEALSILFCAKFRDILRARICSTWSTRRFGGATGWSTRRLPATAEPRCATSPRTSSEWQSVTTGSSPARMASSPSPTAASDPNDCGRCHWTRWNSSAASSSTSCPPGSRRYGTTDS